MAMDRHGRVVRGQFLLDLQGLLKVRLGFWESTVFLHKDTQVVEHEGELSQVLDDGRKAGRQSLPPRQGTQTMALLFTRVGNQALVLRQILRLRERGLGIVLSTHDPDQAFACATSVALLHHGRIVVQGPPEGVLTPASLSEVYGIGVRLDRLSDGRAVVTPALYP